MSTFDKLSAFASVSSTIAKDPFQFINSVGKGLWDFDLKVKSSDTDTLYDRIPELPRNEYGLENIRQLHTAYCRTEKGLPPVEGEKQDLQKTVNICGLEIKYAKPYGIPESDSEVTDSDCEFDHENSTATVSDGPGTDENLSKATLSTSQKQHGENTSISVSGDGALTNIEITHRCEEASQPLEQESQPQPVAELNNLERDDAVENSGFAADTATVTDTDNSELVYGYASTASPGSRRISRVSMIGSMRSRRSSVNTGVQPEVMASDVIPNASELREARRKSSAGMHERRKSVMFRTDCILGFQGATRCRNDVFACQIDGRKFELVVEECPQPDAGMAGVQCSAADIDGTMDVHFADLPLVEEAAKAEKADVAVQWTGQDEIETDGPVSAEGEDNIPASPQKQPQPAEMIAAEPRRLISEGLARKSAPADLGTLCQGSSLSRPAEDVLPKQTSSNAAGKTAEVMKLTTLMEEVYPPQTEGSPSLEGKSPSRQAVKGSETEHHVMETDDENAIALEPSIAFVEGEEQGEDLDLEAVEKPESTDIAIPDIEPRNAPSGLSEPTTTSDAPAVFSNDDDGDGGNGIDDNFDFDGPSLSDDDGDLAVEGEDRMDMEFAQPKDMGTLDVVKKETSVGDGRTTVVIAGGVDIQPETTDESASKVAKKRKRGKQSRHVNGGKRSGRSTGNRKKGPSRRELKGLGLTSVHIPQADKEEREEEEGGQPRRSKRRKFPPLQYWKNEKKVYERRMSQLLPTIAEVVVAVEQDSDDDSDVSWENIKSRGVVNSRR